MIFFYFSYSTSLNSYNLEIYDGFNLLQNVITKVHNEDSQLYKILLSKDTRNNVYSITNYSTNVIVDLLNLKKNKLFPSQKIVSTINGYYSLKKLRKIIVELHRQNILTNDDEITIQISKLTKEYETQINIIGRFL